jgi:PEP-CTERM motif
MMQKLAKVALIVACVAVSGYAGSFQTLGTDDIFLSGGNTYTSAGGGEGNAPTSTFGVAGGQIVTFAGVTGSWSCCSGGGTYNGPDGGGFAGGSTNLVPIDGSISGITDTSSTMFLVGVFLGPSLPASRPANLDFSPGGLTQSFSSLSPELGQVFFIGDGLTGTGSGSTQQFIAPAGSATLYLGVADGDYFTGLPGYYYDNLGSVSGTISINNPGVPEPSSLLLLGGGLWGLMALARRRFSARS